MAHGNSALCRSEKDFRAPFSPSGRSASLTVEHVEVFWPMQFPSRQLRWPNANNQRFDTALQRVTLSEGSSPTQLQKGASMTTQENVPADSADKPEASSDKQEGDREAPMDQEAPSDKKASSDEEASKDRETSRDEEAPSDKEEASGESDTPTEKPEPDEDDKEEAKKMMTAYEPRPTLVLPGTGGAVSGTAVNDWLDDEGNPSAMGDEDAPAAKAKSEGGESSAEAQSADDQKSSGDQKASDDQQSSDEERSSREERSSDEEQSSREERSSDEERSSREERSSDEEQSSREERSSDDEESSDKKLSLEEQIEKDKEFNKAVTEQAEKDKDLSEEELAQSEREEKSVTR